MEAPEHTSSTKKRKQPEPSTGSGLATVPDPKVRSKGQIELMKALTLITKDPEFKILEEHRFFKNFKNTFLRLKKELIGEDDATTQIDKLKAAFETELKFAKGDIEYEKQQQAISDAITKDSEYRKEKDKWYQANLKKIREYGLNIIDSAYKHEYSESEIEGLINKEMANAQCTGKGQNNLPTFRIVLGTIKGVTHTIVFSVDEASREMKCFHAGEGG